MKKLFALIGFMSLMSVGALAELNLLKVTVAGKIERVAEVLSGKNMGLISKLTLDEIDGARSALDRMNTSAQNPSDEEMITGIFDKLFPQEAGTNTIYSNEK